MKKRYILTGVGSFIITVVLFLTMVAPIFDRRSFWDIMSGSSDDVEPVAEEVLSPYDYIPATVNGGFNKYVVNWSYGKQFLKDNFKWRLQASGNNVSWSDANSLLSIDLKEDAANYSYKVTLTLDTTTAPKALYYRFDLAVNRSLKNYVERDGWEWQLSVPTVDGGRDYNIMFNWSDIKSLVDTGKVWFDKGVKDNFFWFRVQTVNKIDVGMVFVVDPTYGLIASAITDSWEFDQEEGDLRTPHGLLKMGTSEYYITCAFGDTGTDRDGFLRVLKVWENNGTIQESLVDSWEYDTSDGYYASIYHISGDVYAVTYYDAGATIGKIMTTRAWESNGTLQETALDTFNLAYSNYYTADMVHVTGDVYAVVYMEYGGGYDDQIETVEITSDGIITDARLDIEEFDATSTANIVNPVSAVMVDTDTIAVVWQETATWDAWMCTYNISGAGLITDDPADTYEWDTGATASGDIYYPHIYKITDMIYAVTYADTDQDGWTKTINISGDGDICSGFTEQFTDTLEWGNSNTIAYMTMFTVEDASLDGTGIYGITYKDSAGDGWVMTMDIDTLGANTGTTDTLEFDGADCAYNAPCVYVGNNFYLVAYTGTDNDGWSATFGIYTNNPPTLSGESPSDGAIDVSATPELSVNFSDYDEYWVNTSWNSNSSGSWVEFATNNSHSLGSVSDVINSYEYNEYYAQYPDVIKLGSDGTFSYYAIVYMGTVGGWINTTKVWESNGTIYPGTIDSYQYDEVYARHPNIVHVSGDVYIIAYYTKFGSIYYNFIKSVTIDSVGSITDAVIDSFNFSRASLSINDGLKIMSIKNNIYAIVSINFSTASTPTLMLDTCYIDDSGVIGDTFNDSIWVVTDELYCAYHDSISVDDDTVAIVFTDYTSTDGFIITYNISDTGDITNSYADVWEYDESYSTMNKIVHVYDNIYSTFYKNVEGYGYCKSFSIDDSGVIGHAVIDGDYFTKVGTIANIYPVYIGNNIYAINFFEIKIVMSSIKIDIDGSVTQISYGGNKNIALAGGAAADAPIVQVKDDIYAVFVDDGSTLDGWIYTVHISNETPTIHQTNSNFSAPSTTYYWSVNCTDGVNWCNETYSFTTAAGGEPEPTWQILDDTINGSIYNSTGTWKTISTDVNGSIYNSSGAWKTISTNINGSIFNSTGTWNIISNTINGSIFNNTGFWNVIGDNINGSIYNSSIASWTILSETINGSIWNSTGTWTTFSTNINGSIYNSSGIWNIISNTINGSIYNMTGSWNILSNTINGSIYNSTGIWNIISNTINGSIYNTSSWIIISDTINGSIYNSSGVWNIISNTINGSIFNNTGSWKVIDNTINGSIFNSTGNWNIISSSINGSIFNSSGWKVISDTINGSIYNSSGSWNIISNTINGSIYNITGSWKIISNTINGSIFNSTGNWNIISNTINGSIYNSSSWNVISSTINGSVYNSSGIWNVLDSTINGSLYNNTGSWQVLSNTVNGSIYNGTVYWNIISNIINGSIYNSSTWKIIDNTINGFIFNTSISIILSNPSPNGTIVRLSINSTNVSGHTGDIQVSITRNHTSGNLMNTSIWFNNTFLFTNSTWGNGTIEFWLFDYYNGTIQSGTTYNWTVNCSASIDYANESFNFSTSVLKNAMVTIISRLALGLVIGIGFMIPFIFLVIKRRKRRNKHEYQRETLTLYRR